MVGVTGLKAGQAAGSYEIKKQGARKEFNKALPPRETDGTAVTATVGLVLSENFQSVKVEASVILPTTDGAKSAAMQEAWEFVDTELANHLEAARRMMKTL